MISAKGARAYLVLGATLLAAMQPVSALAGIHGSSVAGIHGSSVDGIHGSSVDGIHGSSVDGIHGSSVDGIHGSSVDGIHGSSVDGIHGSSVDGIHGSSVDGIHGSSVDGIHGSSVTVLAGQVDSIDTVNGVFMAVGQTVMASQAMLASMAVGDFVTVNGSVVSSGWLYADSISVANSLYVPGATSVFVMGIPSKIDRVLGQAQLGELTIDYTAAMSSGAIPSGLSLSFSGIQPVGHGLFVSDEVSAVVE
jgi:outer membrane lipoprotein SlyB